MIHETSPAGYAGNLDQLAEEIGNLRYDALQHFLDLLGNKLRRDSCNDQDRGRARLASQLRDSAEHLNEAAIAVGRAWKICEPHM